MTTPHDHGDPPELSDAEVDDRFAALVRDFGPHGTQRWRSGELLDIDQLGSGATTEPDFVPPRPPAPRGEPAFWATLACLVAGPLTMLWGFILDSDDGGTARWLGVSLTVIGILLLVARLPREADRSDDDEGAVV